MYVLLKQTEQKMKLLHTSPAKIQKIKSTGVFGECLFFSSEQYAMGEVKAVYELEIADEKIIEVSELYSEEIITDICNALDVDEEQAGSLLDASSTAFDFGLGGEDDWYIQGKQGECAKLMGYEAVQAEDEQGAVYIVPMLNREGDLVLIEG